MEIYSLNSKQAPVATPTPKVNCVPINLDNVCVTEYRKELLVSTSTKKNIFLHLQNFSVFEVCEPLWSASLPSELEYLPSAP